MGKIWPQPNNEEIFEYHKLDPKSFYFELIGETCDILDEAIIRYTKMIKESINNLNHQKNDNDEISKLHLATVIYVNLQMPCEKYPYLEMDESYTIHQSHFIITKSIWGMLRALESFSQLIIPINGMLKVPNVKIIDSPRFPHRGLMVDTARHYINLDIIYKILDGMAYNKLNVFHWHIVDDQSFPYQSTTFPELSKRGAFSPSKIYQQTNIAKVIEYARMRGIRVIPEFDIPEHTRSWGNSHPELLTKCEWVLNGKLGPLNPILNDTYSFLHKLFREVTHVFPEKYLHIGGNDISFECWASNDDIAWHITSKNILSAEVLYKNFMKNITSYLVENSVIPIIWQEGISPFSEVPKGTIVQVQLENWESNLFHYTKLGHRVILSQCWYLNKKFLNTEDIWENNYYCDPHHFDGSAAQKKLVVGGEAFIWTNLIGNHNILKKIFPIVSLTAERLWSNQNVRDMRNATQRLEEHTCRMVTRGISIQSITGVSFC